jgi:oligoribonuclease NrnB/cAMP/cGMP phosphodiesterase (DHH superfamily)
MKALVIYHKADYDGKFSRDVCVFHLQRLNYEVNTAGWDYGDETPNIEGYHKIFLVDISIPSLLEDENTWPDLVWIDHHKTAIEKYSTKIPGLRLDGVAACRLCWNYFTRDTLTDPTLEDFKNRKVNEPMIITLAGEYDVWDKRDPNAELLQLGLKSAKWDMFDSLEHFAEDIGSQDLQLGSLLDAGHTIQGYVDEVNASIVSRAYFAEFHDLILLVCNTIGGNSLLFNSRQNEAFDACCTMYFDGKVYRVSLFHKKGNEHIDLSAIAKKYGGGGHKGACGFSSVYLPAELLEIVD